MRAQIIGTLLSLSVVGSLQGTAAADSAPGIPAQQAFQFFAALPETTIESVLENLRPAPVDAEEKRRALSMLPAEGELRPRRDEVAKLASLRPVLIYHKREEVFETKVIDLPQAAIVLHGRSIVLITRPALRLVSAPELQAIVAHEIGHEFFWTEYEHARDRGDAGARHELELRCDAIAILTLLGLDLDPRLVISAARKLTRFNERHGATVQDALYPTTAEREKFTRAIVTAYERAPRRR